MDNPLVLIHGSGDSTGIWRFQLALHQSSRIFAIDLPGHGKRPDIFPAEVTVLDYARAVHEIIHDELKLDHPIIGGHSLGGAIALTMGLEYASDLAGLILIGTGARLRVRPEILETARTNPQLARLQLGNPGITSNDVKVPLEAGSGQPDMLYRDLAACNGFDCMARIHEIHLPTFIICGANDIATPVKYSQYLHDHMDNSVLRIIPEASHYVMREQPELVNSAIEEWLQRY